MPCVLIVDDERDNVELLGLSLADGYEIRFATSGRDALALVDRQAFDLILLDVMMPEMDGYEVLAGIRAREGGDQVPVIFVTARGDPDSETRALAAGAVDYIHKPINISVLRARVRTHIALRQRERAYRELNDQLEQKVEARTLALRDALARAESATLAKSAFLANISHELRTPLNAVMGLSALLERELPAAGRSRERAAQIHAAGRELLELISRIVDTARLDAHRLIVSEVDFSLPLVVDSVVAPLLPRARARGLAVDVDLAPGLDRPLRGDPLRIGQILGHYLDNAIKFSTHGRIAVRLRLDAGHDGRAMLRMEVEDEAGGVPPEIRERLFMPFVTGDESMTREHGGLGLGLTICRQLAHLLGGDVGVDSAPGRGSTFRATVAVAFAPRPAADVDVADRHVLAYIDLLLAESDVRVHEIWRAHRDRLSAQLGDVATLIDASIERFDFEAALELLRAAAARHPALAGYRA